MAEAIENNEEVIVDDLEETNEEVTETTEETQPKAEKPKRTPQEEYEYHMGRAKRAAKKAGIEVSEEKPEVKKETSKPNELDFGQRAYLKSYGIAGSDELALVKQFQDRGFGLDAIVEDEVFTAKLGSLRQARETSQAVPKGQKRSSQGTADSLDVAYAKYQETGVIPEDLDFETRTKLVDKITEKESAPLFR